jgi:hypothetical protein
MDNPPLRRRRGPPHRSHWALLLLQRGGGSRSSGIATTPFGIARQYPSLCLASGADRHSNGAARLAGSWRGPEGPPRAATNSSRCRRLGCLTPSRRNLGSKKVRVQFSAAYDRASAGRDAEVENEIDHPGPVAGTGNRRAANDRDRAGAATNTEDPEVGSLRPEPPSVLLTLLQTAPPSRHTPGPPPPSSPSDPEDPKDPHPPDGAVIFSAFAAVLS